MLKQTGVEISYRKSSILLDSSDNKLKFVTLKVTSKIFIIKRGYEL